MRRKNMTLEEYITYKRENEKKMIHLMISIYCRCNHKNSYNRKTKAICEECSALYNYAVLRIDRCRYTETKTFCSACPTPCYNRDMKEKVKKMMAFSGKRMLIYNPLMALKHVYVMIKHNIQKNKAEKIEDIFKGAI